MAEEQKTENNQSVGKPKLKFEGIVVQVFERLSKCDDRFSPTAELLGEIIKDYDIPSSYAKRPYAIIFKMKNEIYPIDGTDYVIQSMKTHPLTNEKVSSFEKGWIKLIPKPENFTLSPPVKSSEVSIINEEQAKTEQTPLPSTSTVPSQTVTPPVPQPIQVIKADIDVKEKQKLLVPNKPDDANYIHRKIENTTDMEIIKGAYDRQKNVLLTGPPGCGKTHSARHFAYENKLPYASVELHGGVEISDLIGQWVPTEVAGMFKWVDGLLTFMVRNGGVFVAEEVNYMPSDFSSKLHGLLDKQRRLVLTEKDGEIVHANPKFCFIACMNPGAEGTHPLTEAFQDRFDVALCYDYDEKIEKQLIKNEKLLTLASKLRTMYYNNREISTIVSTRMLLQFEDNVQQFGTSVAERIFYDKFEMDEKGKIKEVYELLTKPDTPIADVEEVFGKDDSTKDG